MKNVRSQGRTVHSEYLLWLFTLKEYIRHRTIVTANNTYTKTQTHTHTHTLLINFHNLVLQQ